MNKLPVDFSPAVVTEIRSRLDTIRADGTRILFAIESGSRAWGFPSPDSDYDCRFVYARPTSQHLVLQQPRDVIKFPIVDEIDAGGWDLRKAILLALDGNAVVSEWAKSPIVYEEIDGFRPRFIELLAKILDPAMVARHYLGLARTQLYRMGNIDGEIHLKKLFYVIRPIIALEWMEQRSFNELPPMSLPECLSQSEIPHDVAAGIQHMIAEKSLTREMGTGRAPQRIAAYLTDRFQHFEREIPVSQLSVETRARHRTLADDFYSQEAGLA
jgi:predicted nucleotidyltransferase